jgi:hypothetical protein
MEAGGCGRTFRDVPGMGTKSTQVHKVTCDHLTGGEELRPFAKGHLPFMSPSFKQLTARTLVVAGDQDQSQMSSRGPDWFTDAFTLFATGERAVLRGTGVVQPAR